MSPAPQTSLLTEDEHVAEAENQAKIAAEVAATDPPKAVVGASQVTLRSKNVEQYPLTLSVVGGLALVFESADSTLVVASEVAEQVIYLQNVEVVA